MKKKEIWILAVIAAAALIGILVIENHRASQPGVNGNGQAYATGDDIDHFVSASGITVGIYHRDQLVYVFDPKVDGLYHVDGDYGGLDVEVKDGKWHVTNEHCPNHICASMGWVDENELIPITCLPNNIYIYPIEAGNAD